MGDLSQLPFSPKPDVLHVVVESPAGATTKLKWEPTLRVFTVSRSLPLGLAYPHDWGFVPGTRAPDGDPVDALVLSEGTTYPGVLLSCYAIGVVQVEQNREVGAGRERNDRLIAVPTTAARNDVRTHAQLPVRVRQEIERFFLNTTFFGAKDAAILGWGDPDEAWRLVRASLPAPSGS